MSFRNIFPIVWFFVLNIVMIASAQNRADILVTSFGADGSDQLDDTEAIQGALKRLEPGDKLFFPAGTYLINKTLRLNESNVTLEFNYWAKLKANGSPFEAVISVYPKKKEKRLKNLTFSNLNIDGDGIASKGIQLIDCDSVTFVNPQIFNLFGYNKRIASAMFIVRAHDLFIRNGIFKNISNPNPLKDERAIESSGIHLSSTGLALSERCNNVIIENCYFEEIKAWKDSDGVKFIGRPKTNDAYGYPVFSTVSNNTFKNCYKRAIKVQNSNVLIKNNTIRNDRISNETGAILIDLQGVEDVMVINNNIEFNNRNKSAMGISTNFNSRNCLFENDTIVFKGELNGKQCYGFRTENSSSVMDSITLRGVAVYGNLSKGIWLQTKSGSGKGWLLDKIESPGNYFQSEVQFDDIIIRESSFDHLNIRNKNAKRIKLEKNRLGEDAGLKTPEPLIKAAKVPGTNLINASLEKFNKKLDWVAGRKGRAIRLNGKDDYIDLSGYGLKLAKNNSISVWLMVDNKCEIGDGPHVLYPGICSNSPNGSWDNYISFVKDKGIHLQYEDESGQVRRSEAFQYKPGLWLHLVIVTDRSGAPIFYVNGKASGKGEPGSVVSLNYLGLGYAGAANKGAFPGVIDEFRFYNKLLSGDSVKAMFKTGR